METRRTAGRHGRTTRVSPVSNRALDGVTCRMTGSESGRATTIRVGVSFTMCRALKKSPWYTSASVGPSGLRSVMTARGPSRLNRISHPDAWSALFFADSLSVTRRSFGTRQQMLPAPPGSSSSSCTLCSSAWPRITRTSRVLGGRRIPGAGRPVHSECMRLKCYMPSSLAAFSPSAMRLASSEIRAVMILPICGRGSMRGMSEPYSTRSAPPFSTSSSITPGVR